MENLPRALKSPFRSKLSSVFVLVAFFALGLTALKMATHGWTVAVTSITATLFLAGLFRIIFGPTSARTFWSGFTICGAGYLALLLILHWYDSPPDRSRKKLVNDLATTEALDFLARKFNPEVEKLLAANMPHSIFDFAEADLFLDQVRAPSSMYFNLYTSRSPTMVTPGPSDSDSDNPFSSPVPAIAESTDKTDSSAANVVPSPFDDPPAPSDVESASSPPVSMNWRSKIPLNPIGSSPTITPSSDGEALAERLRNFPRIGHCLFALAFGWIGATLAVVFTRSRNIRVE